MQTIDLAHSVNVSMNNPAGKQSTLTVVLIIYSTFPAHLADSHANSAIICINLKQAVFTQCKPT